MPLNTNDMSQIAHYVCNQIFVGPAVEQDLLER
jgi:hypothetical protein